MCTVTYLPTGNNQFILTSSRDEQPGRKTSAIPRQVQIGESTLLLPQDEQAGGTWIAASNRAVLCLLNGALEPHRSKPPYRHSRGLVILHYFDYASPAHFIADYPFDGLESFTLIIREVNQLLELRWDEKKLRATPLEPDIPHLWASATLYEAAILAKRQQWFSEWLKENQSPDIKAIRTFHRTAGEGDPENDLFMRRKGIQTVSLTSIVKDNRVQMWYEAFGRQPEDAGLSVQILPQNHPSFSS